MWCLILANIDRTLGVPKLNGWRRCLESRFCNMEVSMGMMTLVAIIMVVLILGVDAVQFDGYDGRPRPPGMLDAPTQTLGDTPAVNFSGKPAECIWYGWAQVFYKDSGCIEVLWLTMQTSDATTRMMGGPGYLEAFRYFFESDSGTSADQHNCTIGCFDLRAAPPRAKPSGPPPALAIPPARAPSPLLNPPTSIPSSTITPEAPSSSAPGPMAPSSKLQVGLIAGVCSAGVGGLLIMGLLLLFCSVKRRRKLGSASGLSPDTTASRSYTFKELSVMTNSFSRSELLSSSGGFGEVFKGTPPSGTGKPVAVKRIRQIGRAHV